MNWVCNNCEHLNNEKIYVCEVCDSQSPNLAVLTHKQYAESNEAVFLISWKIENVDSLVIDNEIGDVKAEGEHLLKITKNTTIKL